VGTAVIYLLVMIGVAAVVFVAAALIFGRGEELAPLPPGHTPTRLPFGEIAGDDVRAVRFQQVRRGYRMSEVDWVLERLAAELDRTTDERDGLRDRVDELEQPLPATDGSGAKRAAPAVVEREPAPTAMQREPAAVEPEPTVAVPAPPPTQVDEPLRPTPTPRQMLSRETEDAGER
jgi:DivIVA domain-containing protein